MQKQFHVFSTKEALRWLAEAETVRVRQPRYSRILPVKSGRNDISARSMSLRRHRRRKFGGRGEDVVQGRCSEYTKSDKAQKDSTHSRVSKSST